MHRYKLNPIIADKLFAVQTPGPVTFNEQNQQAWRSLKTGNHQALEALYQAFSCKLYNYGSKFTSDKELVKESIFY